MFPPLVKSAFYCKFFFQKKGNPGKKSNDRFLFSIDNKLIDITTLVLLIIVRVPFDIHNLRWTSWGGPSTARNMSPTRKETSR